MNITLGTVVQSWSKRVLILVTTALIFLHIGIFLLGALLVPALFHTSKYSGSSCQSPAEQSPTWYENALSTGSCVPINEKDGERVPLSRRAISFRFPRSSDEVSSYSRWNWRIIGSLMLDITFKGADSIPGSFNATEAHGDLEEDVDVAGTTTVPPPVYEVSKEEIRVEMRAVLESRPLTLYSGQNASSQLGGWIKEDDVSYQRTLQCTVSKPSEGYQFSSSDLVPSAQYLCTLSPLVDIQVPGNKSYIVTLEFKQLPVKGEEEKRDGFLKAENSTKPEDITESITKDVITKEFFTKPSNINSILTVIVENREYHKALFYLKCLSTPFVLTALVWFVVRMYLNDLYVSIPDRLVILAGFVLFLQNIPTEVLLTHWPVAYLKLLDEFLFLCLLCVLLLFWAVYTMDKVAKNEPWERNTKYYDKVILLVVFGIIMTAIFVIYASCPSFEHPFNNHWQTDSEWPWMSASGVQLYFIFFLSMLAFIYQTFLSVLVFRVLCDVSVQYPAVHRGWRIKMVLLYCYGASLLTIGGFVFKLSIHLGLFWNPQFYIDPIPFHLRFASTFLLGFQGFWFLHITSLLVMLSRSGSGHLNSHNNDLIKPVSYNSSNNNQQDHAPHNLHQDQTQQQQQHSHPDQQLLQPQTSDHQFSTASGEYQLQPQHQSDSNDEQDPHREQHHYRLYTPPPGQSPPPRRFCLSPEYPSSYCSSSSNGGPSSMEPQLMTAESLHYWEMSRLHEEEREALMMEQYYQQQQYQNGYQFVKSCSSPLPEEEVM